MKSVATMPSTGGATAVVSGNENVIEHEIENFVENFKKHCGVANSDNNNGNWLERPFSLEFAGDSGDNTTSCTPATTTSSSASSVSSYETSADDNLIVVVEEEEQTTEEQTTEEQTTEEQTISFLSSPNGNSSVGGSSAFESCSEGHVELLPFRECVMGDAAGDRELTVIDVADLLQARYAFISGGKDRHGRTIVTFPDNPGSSETTDDKYRKCVTYLSGIPTVDEIDVGFVIIVDRRRDKWSSVKTILYKIAGFFPADLHMVFILRPKGFFQRAISDMGYKMVKDEYKFQVVMCNNAEELHEYIDACELTDDFGGSIHYNHEQWVQHRAAIEKFSSNMNDICKTMQEFITQLQETEMPNDTPGTQELIRDHNAQRKEVQEDLQSAVDHGESLLNCIRSLDDWADAATVTDASAAAAAAEASRSNNLVHIIAVERLLEQLTETMDNFDDFWSKHEKKLGQCLQLRKFEEDFRQIQYMMDKYLDELEHMTEAGETLQRVETLLQRVEQIRDETTEAIEKADELIENGEKFIGEDYYAVDCIRPKCMELKRMRDQRRELLDGRRKTLETSYELQTRIDKASQWCTHGVDLLATQQIENIQTEDGAKAAIADIETFLVTVKDLKLNNPKEFRNQFEHILTSDTRSTVQQVLKRIDDVRNMCEKRRDSLRRVADKPPRPVQAVIPKPSSVATPSPRKHKTTPTKSPSDLDLRRRKHLSDSNKKSRSLDHRKIRLEVVKVDDNDSSTSVDSEGELPYLSMISGSKSQGSLIEMDSLHAKRGLVMRELIETERLYVSELNSIIVGYLHQLHSTEMKHVVPDALKAKSSILFGNLEEIYAFHSNIFLRDLENCIDTPSLVGQCFIDRKGEFQIYSKYCQNKTHSDGLRKLIGDNHEFFKECQKKLGHRLPLSAYLLKPVQRITKYQLLLKEMYKYTQNDIGNEELEEAVDAMLEVLRYVNDIMHSVAITGFKGNFDDLGKFLMQGPFNVWVERKDTKLKDMYSRFTGKPMHRNVFLYERGILLCKKHEDPNHIEKATYIYKNMLKMSDIGLTENVKTDKKKFEIWSQGRTEVYICQALTQEMKLLWLKEIKRVLMLQFASLKEQQVRIRKGSMVTLTSVGSNSSAETDNISCSSRPASVFSRIENNNPGVIPEDSADYRYDEGWTSEEFDSEDDSGAYPSSSSLQNCLLLHYAALADYHRVDDSELSMKEGDLVDVLKCGSEGWWYVRHVSRGDEGWVPSSYLEVESQRGSRSTLSVSSIESTNGNQHSVSSSHSNLMKISSSITHLDGTSV